ncbi:MAG: hypothetical protein LBB23_00650 [Rickettsiales bacterium]|jgi:hypothetical protein|nr:hypothetical protein [Rickettsiales bacterium]
MKTKLLIMPIVAMMAVGAINAVSAFAPDVESKFAEICQGFDGNVQASEVNGRNMLSCKVPVTDVKAAWDINGSIIRIVQSEGLEVGMSASFRPEEGDMAVVSISE